MLDIQRTYFKAFILLSFIYILFQVKPWGSVSGAIYSGDDHSYYGYISSLVNDFDLDFSNNGVAGNSGVSPVTGRIVVGHPIGTSIMLMPFYVIAKPIVLLVQKFTGAPFNQKHVIFFMFMCSGILLYTYLGGCLLLTAIIRLGIRDKIALEAVFLSLFGSILPAYVFRRPILSHIPEFFLISLAVYMLIIFSKSNKLTLKQLLLLGIVSGGILITRWNDVYLVILIMFWLLSQNNKFTGVFKNKLFILFFYLSLVGLVFFFTQSLAWKCFYGTYFTLFPLNKGAPLSEIISLIGLKNLVHIFIGLDWGIVITMLPFCLGLFAFLIFLPLRISRNKILDRLLYLALFSLPFIIVLSWQQQACYYGYRFLLSLLPFTCIGLAQWLQNLQKKSLKMEKIIFVSVIIILIFNFLLMLPFEYKESTSLYEHGISPMGRNTGWINNAYIPNAIKIYFTLPINELVGMFSRGFLGGYIFAVLYLLNPIFFAKLTSNNPKVSAYYALDSLDKIIVLVWPLLVFILLWLTYRIIKKYRKIIYAQ